MTFFLHRDLGQTPFSVRHGAAHCACHTSCICLHILHTIHIQNDEAIDAVYRTCQRVTGYRAISNCLKHCTHASSNHGKVPLCACSHASFHRLDYAHHDEPVEMICRVTIALCRLLDQAPLLLEWGKELKSVEHEHGLVHPPHFPTAFDIESL